jgi:hypothetical protein
MFGFDMSKTYGTRLFKRHNHVSQMPNKYTSKYMVFRRVWFDAELSLHCVQNVERYMF